MCGRVQEKNCETQTYSLSSIEQATFSSPRAARGRRRVG